jgi:ABC-2 type transport system permease protein
MGGGKEGSISQEIYQGTMSRYLIYPMSYLYMKYVQFLATALFHLLKFFILLSVASFFTKALSHLSITSVFFYLSFVFLGMHFIFFLFTLLESMAFWADNVWSLQVMLRTSVQIMGGLFSPLIFFPTAMQSFLPFSPLTHCIFTPTFLIMGKTSYPLLPSYLSLMLGLVILATLQRMVWKRGIIKFEAAGM